MACGGFGLYASKRGKFVVWAELLDRLNLSGDEWILHMGCGRGAILLLAAERLTTGRAVGVDLWRKGDQSGNAAEVTMSNAVAEGVADRVELHTADMAALPFEDDSFDVIVSNIAVHNIKGRISREKAIEEAVRVLRPDGRLMIADIFDTRQYSAHLMKQGMRNVANNELGTAALTDCMAAIPCSGWIRARAFMTKVEKAKKTPAISQQPSAESSVNANCKRSMFMGIQSVLLVIIIQSDLLAPAADVFRSPKPPR